MISGLERHLVKIARVCLSLGLLLFASGPQRMLAGQLYINEVLFNPLGDDAPNQYIELRGTPNDLLTNGVYFITIDGANNSTNSDVGKIRDVFPLGGYRLGNNPVTAPVHHLFPA